MPEQTQYAVYLEQDGEGCDYTIGCGSKLVMLDAKTAEDAIEECRRFIPAEHTHESEIKSATLVLVGGKLPVGDWYAEVAQRKEAEQAKADEDKERAKLAELSAKYT